MNASLPAIDCADAAAGKWDAVVIGAGPAGAFAARQLALRRLRVLLVDAKPFPRAKVCGGCLGPRALGALAECGLKNVSRRLNAVPLRELEVRTSRRSRQFRLPGGVSVTRGEFDTALLEAALEAGARFLPGTTAVVEQVTTHETRLIELRQGALSEVTAASIVLAADGLNRSSVKHLPGLASVVRPAARLGVGAVIPADQQYRAAFESVPPGRVVMAIHDRGYVGLVRAEDNQLTFAAALDPVLLKSAGSMSAALAKIVEAAGLPSPFDLGSIDWRGTPLLTSRPQHRAAERLFLIGDSAGYVEPFTGEGMAWAIEAALAVEPLAVQACRGWDSSLVASWERVYRERIRRSQWICRGLTAILRSPSAVSAALSIASRFPGIAASLISSINQRRRAGGAVNWKSAWLSR